MGRLGQRIIHCAYHVNRSESLLDSFHWLRGVRRPDEIAQMDEPEENGPSAGDIHIPPRVGSLIYRHSFLPPETIAFSHCTSRVA